MLFKTPAQDLFLGIALMALPVWPLSIINHHYDFLRFASVLSGCVLFMTGIALIISHADKLWES